MSLVLPTGGEFKAGNEYVSDCPSCGREKKFSWNYVKLKGQCFVCGMTALGTKAYKILFREANFEENYKPELPATEKEVLPLDLHPVWVCHKAVEYLKSRRVYKYYDMQYSESSESLYIPLTKTSPEIPPCWQTRKIYGSSFWRNLKGYESSKYLYGPASESNTAILVEGVFDLLTPQLWGLGHALLGSKISEEQCYFLASHYTSVILWLDDDKAGRLGTIRAREKLEAWGLMVGVKRTPLDPGSYHDNEWLKKLRSQVNDR